MHHYPFHVGDYAGHTQHLDDLEDLAYRRMLDFIYLNETNLPESVDEIARLIRMRTHCERIAIVLREFFTLENSEWINKRASIEIAKYQAKSEKAKGSANKRWGKADANAMPTQCEGNANQNQEPITSKSKEIAPAKTKTVANVKPKKEDGAHFLINIPDLHPKVAADYLAVRKDKGVAALTETAVMLIDNQAKKVGLTLAQAITFATGKGWAGFNANWYLREMQGDGQQKTHAERTQDYKDKQAAEFYKPLLDMTEEERKEWGFE